MPGIIDIPCLTGGPSTNDDGVERQSGRNLCLEEHVQLTSDTSESVAHIGDVHSGGRGSESHSSANIDHQIKIDDFTIAGSRSVAVCPTLEQGLATSV